MKSLVGCTLVDFTAILLNTPFQPGTSLATYKIKLNEITANNNNNNMKKPEEKGLLQLTFIALSAKRQKNDENENNLASCTTVHFRQFVWYFSNTPVHF